MSFIRKSRIAYTLLQETPGWRARARMVANMYSAKRHSRLGGARPGDAAEAIRANAWADYFLLSHVDRPVVVRARPGQRARIWFVVPQLDPTVIFGGYIALMQLVRVLQEQGYPTGFVVQSGFASRRATLESFAANAMVHPVLSSAELIGLEPGRRLEIGSGDMLVAYNWTTALLCAKIAHHLECRSYYYFVQEDERIFYVNDSTRFLAESLYYEEITPKLICNSRKLFDHLVDEGLVAPETEAVIFEQAIPPADLGALTSRAGARTRKLVFYGRPEDHAKRNIFTVALMALARAAKSGAFSTEPWEFFMMGSDKMGASFKLDDLTIRTLPRMDYATYVRTLADFDLGMVLMYAPHPSVPPFELVCSGVVTVVNTQRNRDRDWYLDVSANFEPAAPRVDALAAALTSGAARVGDIDARIAAANSYHPSSWEESYADLPSQVSHPIFSRARRWERHEAV